MAITVISSPNQISSAFNQMLYKISSNNTTQPNFNFVADVYVSGFTGIQARLTYPVQPSSIQVQFDISPVIKNYVSYNFIDAFGHIITANNHATATYYVQLGEIYDVSGIPTLYADLTRNPTSNSKSAINTIFDFQQFSLNVLDSYDVSPSRGGGRLLNTTCKNYWIPGQQKLYSFLDQDRIAAKYDLVFRTASGGFVSIISGTFTEETNYNIFNLDLLSMIGGGTVPATADYFELIVKTGADVALATYRTYIDRTCSQFDTYRIHWLNQLGGFDTFNFRKSTTLTEDIDRSQFKTIQRLGYAKSDRLKTNYMTEIMDRVNLQSDWISDAESDLIQTLVESPVVFLENADGSFTAVNISDKTYTGQRFLNGRKIFNVSVNMEYTYNRYRQSL